MRTRIRMSRLAALALLASWADGSSAQTARFAALDDAYDGRYFDAATSQLDPGNRNRLVIGFNSGTDSETWVRREFIASTAAFHRTAAMDTIRVLIRAPAGYSVASVTYSQSGAGSVSRTGKASGGTSWVVAGETQHLGFFTTNPTLSATVDLSGQGRTAVPVSVTTGLFVFSTPQLGSASLAVTAASIEVTLEAKPP